MEIALLVSAIVLTLLAVVCTSWYARMGGTLVHDDSKVGAAGWLTVIVAAMAAGSLICLSQLYLRRDVPLEIPGGIFIGGLVLGLIVLFWGRKHYIHIVATS